MLFICKKTLIKYLTLSLFLIILASCKKDKVITAVENQNKQPVELVKFVTWNVGATHKIEFSYNTDSTLKEYKTSSSNLAWKYTGAFNYNSKKPTEMIYEGVLSTKYTYVNNRVSIKNYLNNDGIETALYSYVYNMQGRLSRLKVQKALNGILSLTQDIIYIYDSNGNLIETHNDWYNEQGNIYATVVRRYESWSAELHINPTSLLHPLYQHQAKDIFDDVVLSTLNKLPLKIVETGNPELGPLIYEYHISHTGKRIDKLNCSVKIGALAPYQTNEAIFHY